MNELTSTEFRKRYPKLEEETLVLVNGHAIGIWTPWRVTAEFMAAMASRTPGEHRVPAHMDPTVTTQAQRDELLRKINRKS